MWDRFDDAMDDVSTSIVELRQEASQLEAELRRLEVRVPAAEDAKQDPVREGSYMNDRYQNELALRGSLQARNAQLTELVRKAKELRG